MTHIARVAAAAALAAAAYAGVPLAPAAAAACSGAGGVTVVVDFHELGGGMQTACVDDGGGDAGSVLFPAAGFPLTYVQRQPGFVCRVSGKPADNPCINTPPADAYWGLWWSDGESGRWTYSTTSVSGIKVPDGGYVALSWNGSSSSVPPGFTPAPHPTATPTPSPTKSPSHQPSSSAPASAQPSQQSSDSPTESASASASPSKKPKPDEKESRSAKPSPSAEPSESPSETPDDVVPTSAEPADPDDGGLPAWVAPVAIVVLFGVAGAAAVVRRRGMTGA